MPTDLLEQIEIEQPSRDSARNAAQENGPERKNQKTPGTPRKSIWRKIFEGHQEFLGLTPD
jgi:hypothetical protein